MEKKSNVTLYLSLALIAAIWGFQPSCIKYLRAEWTSETIVVFRYAIVGIILLGVSWYEERDRFWPDSPQDLLLLIGMGATGILLNNVLQFNGIPYTTVTNTTLISATTPTITAVLAAILIAERLGRIAVGGVVMSFMGVLLIVTKGNIYTIINISFNIGDVLCFSSQVAWALYSLMSISVLKRMSVICSSGWAGIFGCIMTLAYGIVTDKFAPVALSNIAFVSFLYPTLLGGLLALIVWNNGVKRVGASVAASFLNIMPVAGMLAGVMLFNENVGVIELMGTVTILSGVYLTSHF